MLYYWHTHVAVAGHHDSVRLFVTQWHGRRPRQPTTQSSRPWAQEDLTLSVHLSVTLRYVFHTGWSTLKITSRLIRLRFMFGLTPISAIWSIGNIPKIGAEEGWGHEHKLQHLNGRWCIQESRAVAQKPHDAVVKFNSYRKYIARFSLQ